MSVVKIAGEVGGECGSISTHVDMLCRVDTHAVSRVSVSVTLLFALLLIFRIVRINVDQTERV